MGDSIVLNFLDKARYCSNVEELSNLIQEIFSSLGFPLWAYQTQSELLLETHTPIIVHNYSDKWVDCYLENNFSKIDPVITLGSKKFEPFQWSKLTQNISLNEHEIEYQSIARDFGMNDGLAIPILGGNGRKSMLSLASDTKNTELPKLLNKNKDQIIALTFAYHSIVKDFIKDDNIIIDRIKLTPRERECLLWIAKGKNTHEIASFFNISRRTVIFHLNNAKQKFNVNSIQHLVVKGIAEGYINI